MTKEEKRLVRSLPLFRGVPAGVCAELFSSRGCVCGDFARGETVFDERHYKKALAVLLRGKLQVEKRGGDGSKLIMSALYAPALFGAAALFNDSGEYPNALTAKEESRALFLPRAALLRAMRESPALAENYVRYLTERIDFLNRRILRLTAGTADQRLAGFLLDNMPEGRRARLPVSMTDTAKSLNMGRASLYRAVERLEAVGAIEKSGNSIIIKSKKILSEV